MRCIYFYVLLAMVVVACTQEHTVSGHIEGLTNDTIYARDGYFEFDIPNGDAYHVQLRPMQAAEVIPGGVRWHGTASEIALYIKKVLCR